MVLAKDLGTGNETDLFCAPDIQHEISLMAGSYALWVRVIDELMAVNESFVGQVQVQVRTSTNLPIYSRCTVSSQAPLTAMSEASFQQQLETSLAENNAAKTLAFAASVARMANDHDLVPGLDGFWDSDVCTTGFDRRRCENISVSGVGKRSVLVRS